MKLIGVICVGVLFGLFIGLVVFLGPFYPHSLPARIWNIEETPMGWLDSLMIGTLGAGHGTLMLVIVIIHFAFWALLGGLVSSGIAILLSKLSSEN
jgi:hypothetical protein